jgi:hypothetical protein
VAGEEVRLGALSGKVARTGLAAGVIGILLGVVLALSVDGGEERFFQAYLVNFCFFLSLALGALFFVLVQHLTSAGWSVVVRRFAEVVASNALPMVVLFVPILFGLRHLYHWADAGVAANDHLLAWKRPFLNTPFFLIRCGIYFAVWSWLSNYFLTRSIRQDTSGDVALTLRMKRLSAPSAVLFALTVTFAAFDLLMSLDPHWFSTIFGVYYFSGGVVGFLAFLPILTVLVQRAGRLEGIINAEHYHDMGKLLFGFIVFWSYIAFSQYMLIWYGNIPEETEWFLRRQTGDWGAISLVLLFGHFVLPFLVLISRFVKRRGRLLAVAAGWVLAMHWVDIYWLVMPGHSPDGVAPFGLIEVACFVGLGGFFLAAAALRIQNRSLVPVGDPRLAESLAFENLGG